MQDDRLLKVKASLLELARQSFIETQAIEQLLVRAKVCDSDEIRRMRAAVASGSARVRQLDKQIETLNEEIEVNDIHSELLERKLNGELLTPDEEEFIERWVSETLPWMHEID